LENKGESLKEEETPFSAAEESIGHSIESTSESQYKFTYIKVSKIAIATNKPLMLTRHFRQF